MPNNMPPVAILAGGLATRMRPRTETVPKSMLSVAGAPFIEHQLRLLSSQGIREIVLCTGYLGEQIVDYVGDGSAFDCHVQYSSDGPQLLGTGGSLRRALPLLADAFFVLYGDSYLPIEFAPVYDRFVESRKLGLMTVFRNENQWDTSNVEFNGEEIRQYDKAARNPSMHYIDYGLAVLHRSVFDAWNREERFDLAAVYHSLLQARRLAGFEVRERFYEIGTPEGLAETDLYLSRHLKQIHATGTSPNQRRRV